MKKGMDMNAIEYSGAPTPNADSSGRDFCRCDSGGQYMIISAKRQTGETAEIGFSRGQLCINYNPHTVRNGGDGRFNIRHAINYCPMCGRAFPGEERGME